MTLINLDELMTPARCAGIRAQLAPSPAAVHALRARLGAERPAQRRLLPAVGALTRAVASAAVFLLMAGGALWFLSVNRPHDDTNGGRTTGSTESTTTAPSQEPDTLSVEDIDSLTKFLRNAVRGTDKITNAASMAHTVWMLWMFGDAPAQTNPVSDQLGYDDETVLHWRRQYFGGELAISSEGNAQGESFRMLIEGLDETHGVWHQDGWFFLSDGVDWEPPQYGILSNEYLGDDTFRLQLARGSDERQNGALQTVCVKRMPDTKAGWQLQSLEKAPEGIPVPARATGNLSAADATALEDFLRYAAGEGDDARTPTKLFAQTVLTLGKFKDAEMQRNPLSAQPGHTTETVQYWARQYFGQEVPMPVTLLQTGDPTELTYYAWYWDNWFFMTDGIDPDILLYDILNVTQLNDDDYQLLLARKKYAIGADEPHAVILQTARVRRYPDTKTGWQLLSLTDIPAPNAGALSEEDAAALDELLWTNVYGNGADRDNNQIVLSVLRLLFEGEYEPKQDNPNAFGGYTERIVKQYAQELFGFDATLSYDGAETTDHISFYQCQKGLFYLPDCCNEVFVYEIIGSEAMSGDEYRLTLLRKDYSEGNVLEDVRLDHARVKRLPGTKAGWQMLSLSHDDRYYPPPLYR